MPSVRLDVNKDVLLVHENATGWDGGAGQDHHLVVGLMGGYKARFQFRLGMPDWVGLNIKQIISCNTKFKVNAAHVAVGSNPRFELDFITADWTQGSYGGQGGGAPGSEKFSASNATIYPGSTHVTSSPSPILTGSLGAGISAGDVITIDLADFLELWAPASVLKRDGVTPCEGRTNYGSLAISFDDTLASRAISFDSMEGSTPIYATLVYSANTPPDFPVWDTPINDYDVVTSATPTLAFHGVDVDDTVVTNYDIAVQDRVTFTDTWNLTYQTSGISGMNVSRTYAGTPLVRGRLYVARVATRDAAGNYSGVSVRWFYYDALPTCAILNPSTGGILAQLSMVTGQNTPRFVVAHSYSHSLGLVQGWFRWTVYASNNVGANLGQVYQSGWNAGTATSWVIPFDLTNGNYYLLGVEVQDMLGTQSSMSTLRNVRARWGKSAYYMDAGAAPTSWAFVYQTSGTGANASVYIEYGSNTATSAPGTYFSSVGLIPLNRYFHYRVWLLAWGSSSPTSPTLDSATLTYTTGAVQPDGWQNLPTGASIDIAEYVYGTQSLRIDGVAANPGRSVRQGDPALSQSPINVQSNTKYILSARIKSQGNALAKIRLLDTSGAMLVEVAGASGADWAAYSTPIWDSGGVSQVILECYMIGLGGTSAWFDALKLEASSVVTPWTPGFVGRGVAVDAGGIQVDGGEGSVFRLRASTGGTRDVVEMGPHGLVIGGSTSPVEIYSPIAGVLNLEAARLKEQSAPATPPSGYGYLYPATDHTLHWKDSTGTDTQLGSGAGASFATPAIVLGTAAAAGAASTVIRSDSTIAAFDATAPVTQAFGDVAAAGSIAKAARRDHVHGMPASPSPSGAAGGDLGSTYPNPTVLQASGAFGLTGDISPAQITSNQNNYSPTGLSTASVLRLTTDVTRSITGLAGGVNGRIIVIFNANATNGNDVILVAESASSTAANRFAGLGPGNSPVVRVGQSMAFRYDGTASRWRSMSVTIDSGVPNGSAVGDVGTGGGGVLAADAFHVHPRESATDWPINSILFPASQVSSSNANSLDDYEEGTWTPALAYATPGTSTWAVTTAIGRYTKIGNRVLFNFFYSGVPTNGTASGNLQITGFPFASVNVASDTTAFAMTMGGWTKASYTQVTGRLTVNSTAANVDASGSGQAIVALALGDIPNGGTVIAKGGGHYETAT